MRAYSMKVLNFDISKNVDAAYAAPPLINAMVTRKELDGALNYWNYTARLKALGLKKINDTIIKEATPQVEGMINKVAHLLKVEEA